MENTTFLWFTVYVELVLCMLNCFCALVALVEPSSQPMGVTLVNTIHTNRPSDCMDLVELAHHVQRVCCHVMFLLEPYTDVIKPETTT